MSDLTAYEKGLVLMAVQDKAEVREFRFGEEDPLAREFREIAEKLEQVGDEDAKSRPRIE